MKKIFQFIVLSLLIFPNFSFARENVTDWYIKDFRSEIIVNKDSTLEITETITADCGNLPEKHGIFRILPTRIDKETKTPVELISIRDAKGLSYKYDETENIFDATVTWKIGDPNKTVSGENVYVIKYKVKNVIRFDNENFDELYWNLNGNFWQIETDKFQGRIIFPSEIGSKNSQINLYSGSLGSKDVGLAKYAWTHSNVLEFSSTRTLGIGEGITASITFPKEIISQYVPGFWEKFGNYFFFIIPIITFIVCFRIWKKYGDDPEIDKTVIAEYEPPQNLSPLEIGMLSTNGKLKNEFITAEIIHLATLGFIKIKEVKKKILFIDTKDYEIERINEKEEENLPRFQTLILGAIFWGGAVTTLSSLKNKFYKKVSRIEDAVDKSLKEKGLIELNGKSLSKLMIGFGAVIILGIIFFLVGFSPIMLSIAIVLSGIIIIIFGVIMPKRTMKGAETNWQIKGFELFIKTAEQHRAQFYERENMFEKILPYAIAFGLTREWIGKMKEIYGEEFYASYVPVWYAGSSLGAFDADSLASAISGVSSNIAASTSAPSSSGSGGGGFSGGGGGGGGGGGW